MENDLRIHRLQGLFYSGTGASAPLYHVREERRASARGALRRYQQDAVSSRLDSIQQSQLNSKKNSLQIHRTQGLFFRNLRSGGGEILMQTLKTTTTRRKWRLALFVAVIMALSLWTAVPLTASADGTHEGYTYTLVDNKATITGYTGADATTITELDIPSSVTENGASYPVTAIGVGDGTFDANIAVTTVRIPATVTVVPNANSFPESFTTFIVDALNPAYSSEDGVLFNKDKTTLVSCPRGKAGDNGVYTIPSGVTTITNGFFKCSKLTSLKIPNSVTTLASCALANSGLTSVDIPDSVTTIGGYMFNGCASLTSFTLPERVTSIDSTGMFAGCKSLTSIEIPNIVTEIGERMFDGCNGLTSITIPNHVTSIGLYAFMGCTNANLTSIEIPESVTVLAPSIFANDSQLTSITVKAANPTITGTGNPFSNLPAYIQQLKIWVYDSATAMKTWSGDRTVIMIEAPVLNITSPITLDLDAGDPTNSDTASLEVTGYLPTAQTETDSSKGNHTPTITWSSSNEAAATVNGSGSVLAKAPGTALITATADAHGGDKTASIPVTVAAPTSATTKVLTVQNGTFAGTGSGTQHNEFAENAKVTIVAGKAPDGMVFDKWEIVSSTGGSIVDENEPTAIFTMPDAAATVRATYKHILYTATVENGTGGGSYASGANVNISANAAPSGKVFDSWISDDVTVASASSSSTSFVMPAKAVTVKATYKDAPATPQTYAVTVTGGTDGANGTYAEGATVNITANAPASGKVFDTWTTTDGVTFANANNAATSFVMPAKAVTVTATYKDEPVDPPVDPPAVDSGWVYANGVWKYFVDGVAKTGWIYDQSKWYYANAAGEMQTGWVYDQNKWYYLAGNGAMKTGWVKDNGSWYYLSGNGAMIAGTWFHDTDGNWYYLSGNGKMLAGKHKIGGKAYTFKSNGAWIG
jgi:hypothetical protein